MGSVSVSTALWAHKIVNSYQGGDGPHGKELSLPAIHCSDVVGKRLLSRTPSHIQGIRDTEVAQRARELAVVGEHILPLPVVPSPDVAF